MSFKVLQYQDDNGQVYVPIKAWIDGVELEDMAREHQKACSYLRLERKIRTPEM